MRSQWWLKYIVVTLVLAVFSVLIAWQRGAFDVLTRRKLMIILSDAFFIPGFFALLFGLFCVLKDFILKFSFVDMFFRFYSFVVRLVKQDSVDRKYRMDKYAKVLRERKYTFWYFVIVGAVFVLIGGAFLYAAYTGRNGFIHRPIR